MVLDHERVQPNPARDRARLRRAARGLTSRQHAATLSLRDRFRRKRGIAARRVLSPCCLSVEGVYKVPAQRVYFESSRAHQANPPLIGPFPASRGGADRPARGPL
jgi:hypothetical protein